jgi:haloacetate dehalogenase
VDAYERAFADPDCIAATCADYRAAAGIDLDHDRADAGRRLAMPVTVLWGRDGFIGRTYDPLSAWASYAADLRGTALPCGHFPAEECPAATAAALSACLEPSPPPSRPEDHRCD